MLGNQNTSQFLDCFELVIHYEANNSFGFPATSVKLEPLFLRITLVSDAPSLQPKMIRLANLNLTSSHGEELARSKQSKQQ